MKILFALIFIAFAFLPNSSVLKNISAYSGREELVYEMSYLGVAFAKVYIKNIGTEKVGGILCSKYYAYVHNYGNVPLVDYEAKFHSFIDPNYGYSMKFTRNLKLDENKWEFQELLFDYFGKNKIFNQKWVNKRPMHKSDYKIQGQSRYFDPLALFFKSRSSFEPGKKKSILTFFENKPIYVNINYTTEKKEIQTEAFDRPVKARKVSAYANWDGVYGLDGKVSGWISDDGKRIPLKASVDFIVGQIDIELIAYKTF